MFKHLISMILISVSLLLAGCGSVQKDVAGSDSSIGVSFVRQLVAEDNGTSRTIMWQSEVRRGYSVEYRLKSIGNNGAEQGVAKKASGETGAVFTQAATECSLRKRRLIICSIRCSYKIYNRIAHMSIAL